MWYLLIGLVALASAGCWYEVRDQTVWACDAVALLNGETVVACQPVATLGG
jgi:hypothetical protein